MAFNRNTKSHTFIPPINVPEQEGLSVALRAKRGYFWHPLTLTLDDTETVVALRNSEDKEVVRYARTSNHTRLCSNQLPVKFELEQERLTVELYLDTYSYVQSEMPSSSLSNYPPKNAFRIDWSPKDYWIVATSVYVFRIEVPKGSHKCWLPEERIHQEIRSRLNPEDPPNPLFTISLGVSTSKELPEPRDRENIYRRELRMFLQQHYNSSNIPPKPNANSQPLLSEDGFYFISWQTPTPTPTPSP